MYLQNITQKVKYYIVEHWVWKLKYRTLFQTLLHKSKIAQCLNTTTHSAKIVTKGETTNKRKQ